jgi:hypothetical protein
MTFVTALEGMGWRPFCGLGQAIFSLLGVKPEGKKQEEEKKKKRRRRLNVTR